MEMIGGISRQALGNGGVYVVEGEEKHPTQSRTPKHSIMKRITRGGLKSTRQGDKKRGQRKKIAQSGHTGLRRPQAGV